MPPARECLSIVAGRFAEFRLVHSSVVNWACFALNSLTLGGQLKGVKPTISMGAWDLFPA